MATEQYYAPKHKYYLDLNSGQIQPGTKVIEQDKRYLNRFVPWLAPVPASGKIDLALWQQQAAAATLNQSAAFAELEELRKFKALHDGVPATTTAVLPASTATVVISPESATTLQTVTATDRRAQLLDCMSKLTVNDMTKSPVNPMPTVAALNRLMEVDDVEGPEREEVFAEFKKANPDWKPLEA